MLGKFSVCAVGDSNAVQGVDFYFDLFFPRWDLVLHPASAFVVTSVFALLEASWGLFHQF